MEDKLITGGEETFDVLIVALMIVDSETMEYEAMQNPSVCAGSGSV